MFVSAFQAHVERMEKEATLSEEIPAKNERKHSSSNADTVHEVKNGHSAHEVRINRKHTHLSLERESGHSCTKIPRLVGNIVGR